MARADLLSRTNQIRRRLLRTGLLRTGRLTRRERLELYATGRQLDSVAAQIQMLDEDDVFAALDWPTDLRAIHEDLRDLAQRVMERAQQ